MCESVTPVCATVHRCNSSVNISLCSTSAVGEDLQKILEEPDLAGALNVKHVHVTLFICDSIFSSRDGATPIICHITATGIWCTMHSAPVFVALCHDIHRTSVCTCQTTLCVCVCVYVHVGVVMSVFTTCRHTHTHVYPFGDWMCFYALAYRRLAKVFY